MTATQQRCYGGVNAMNKERFEAFSDGVFAFAITLLILGVALPAFKSPPSDAQLGAALVSLWPNAIAYLLSFAVIGIMWQNHHALFRLIARIDRLTVFYNLLLLCATIVIPFATSVLGTYPTMHSSTLLYGIVLTLCSTCYNLMLMHLIRSDAFHSIVEGKTKRQTLFAYRVGWFTYLGATLVAFAAPLASFALYLLIAGYYLFPRGVDSD